MDTVTHEQTTGAAADHQRFDATSYVDWAAVFAGAVVALAVSFVLMTFGSAVGLAAVSPWTSTSRSVTAVTFGAAFWMILVHIWSLSLGGYLAARMRHRRSGATSTEVEFRDGAHGVIVWGLSVTTGAIIAALVAASIARGGLQLVANTASDPASIASETLLRAPARPSAETPSADTRAEIGRLMMTSTGTNGMSAPDRTYVAQLVAARTGIPQAEAEKRLNDAITQLKDATDKARKAAVLTGFVTAATLLLGAVAAWWGASVGGAHRDEGKIWHGFERHTSVDWSK